MCGIVGVAGGSLTHKDEEVLRELLIIDSLRGKDSTGIAVLRANKTVDVYKKAMNPYDFMIVATQQGAFTGVNRMFIGHNRHATRGAVNNVNAHPFDFEKVVGVHNGTLLSHADLPGHGKFSVDSEVLYHGINELGFLPAMERVNGAYALVWYDKAEETLNMARNTERTLYFCMSKDHSKLYWASEAAMLDLVFERNKIDTDEIYSLTPDVQYCWKMPEYNKPFTKPITRKIKTKEKEITYNRTVFGYAGYTTVPTVAKTKTPLPDKNLTVLTFREGYNGQRLNRKAFRKIADKGCACCGTTDMQIEDEVKFIAHDAMFCEDCANDPTVMDYYQAYGINAIAKN